MLSKLGFKKNFLLHASKSTGTYDLQVIGPKRTAMLHFQKQNFIDYIWKDVSVDVSCMPCISMQNSHLLIHFSKCNSGGNESAHVSCTTADFTM